LEKEPLRFECQPDIIHFDSEGIRNAADYLGVPSAEFKKTFLIQDDGMAPRSLRRRGTLQLSKGQRMRYSRRKTKTMRALPFLA
jgi:hypothetical protein